MGFRVEQVVHVCRTSWEERKAAGRRELGGGGGLEGRTGEERYDENGGQDKLQTSQAGRRTQKNATKEDQAHVPTGRQIRIPHAGFVVGCLVCRDLEVTLPQVCRPTTKTKNQKQTKGDGHACKTAGSGARVVRSE